MGTNRPDKNQQALLREAAQIPERQRGQNFFVSDHNLIRFLERRAPQLAQKRRQALKEIGAFAGGRLDIQAEQTDQNFRPALRAVPDSLSAPQTRRHEIRLNPEYEACQQELYRFGVLADCFDEQSDLQSDSQEARSHILPFATQYMVSQSDIATGCPFAMTHPVAYILDQFAPEAIKQRYLPEILRTDGQTAICGTWATERHSGSDIGGSVTRAHPEPDETEGAHRLYGHNWFTSAFGFQKFMAIKTARPEGAPDGSKGLGLYLVPSHIDEHWQISNNFTITHLKDKLGTRGLPTVEVDLEGALAYEIAPAGQGLKVMMAALGCSRVHNAMAAAGVMRRAYQDSLSWCAHRETFGDKLITRPMIQKRLLTIAAEWQAGSALAFEAAHSFDRAAAPEATPQDQGWMRLVTALAKFRTAEKAVWCAQKALELTGGNGYTEDYPAARQLRDALVLPVWEGPEQVQALELMRMIAGSRPGDDLFLSRLDEVSAALPDEMKTEKKRLQEMRATMKTAFKTLRARPDKAELAADDFLHKMGDILTYALLCDEAGWELGHYHDRTKQLVAEHYYSQILNKPATPSFVPGTLQNHFAAVVAGKPVKPDQKPEPGKGPAP